MVVKARDFQGYATRVGEASSPRFDVYVSLNIKVTLITIKKYKFKCSIVYKTKTDIPFQKFSNFLALNFELIKKTTFKIVGSRSDQLHVQASMLDGGSYSRNYL